MDITAAEKKALLKALGKRLEELIYARYKNKEQFLAATGFYKANLHEIITGKVDPQYITLCRLSRALGVTVEELVKDTGK